MPNALRIDYADQPNRRILNLENAGASGVPVLGLTRHTQQASPVSEHLHPGHLEFGLCLRGALTLSSGGRTHAVMPGQIFVNQPGLPHRLLDQPRGLFLYWMLVRLPEPGRGALLKLPKREALLLGDKLRRLPPVVASDTQQVRQAFVRLFHQHDKPADDFRALCVRQACLRLLIELLACTSPKSRGTDSERLRAIIGRMRQHPGRDYRIDDLAHEAALSPTHFINQFKRATGLPPIHFLIECRMEAAKQQLSATAKPVTEIALALGFSSSQHFATQFRRATGLTPRAWRSAR